MQHHRWHILDSVLLIINTYECCSRSIHVLFLCSNTNRCRHSTTTTCRATDCPHCTAALQLLFRQWLETVRAFCKPKLVFSLFPLLVSYDVMTTWVSSDFSAPCFQRTATSRRVRIWKKGESTVNGAQGCDAQLERRIVVFAQGLGYTFCRTRSPVACR